MKNKLFFSGILSILLVFGLIFVGVGCSDGGSTEYVTNTVTAPPVTTTVTAPPVVTTIEVPSQDLTVVIGILAAAKPGDEVILKNDVTIYGMYDLPVPEGVKLTVPVGVRLLVTGYGRITVWPRATLLIQGILDYESLFFEGQNNQSGMINMQGEFIVDGGQVFDKTEDGRFLTYITKFGNGARMVYGSKETHYPIDMDMNPRGIGPISSGMMELKWIPNLRPSLPLKVEEMKGYIQEYVIAEDVTLVKDARLPIGSPSAGDGDYRGILRIPQGKKLVVNEGARIEQAYGTYGTFGSSTGFGKIFIEKGAALEVAGELQIGDDVGIGVAGTLEGTLTVKSTGKVYDLSTNGLHTISDAMPPLAGVQGLIKIEGYGLMGVGSSMYSNPSLNAVLPWVMVPTVSDAGNWNPLANGDFILESGSKAVVVQHSKQSPDIITVTGDLLVNKTQVIWPVLGGKQFNVVGKVGAGSRYGAVLSISGATASLKVVGKLTDLPGLRTTTLDRVDPAYPTYTGPGMATATTMTMSFMKFVGGDSDPVPTGSYVWRRAADRFIYNTVGSSNIGQTGPWDSLAGDFWFKP